LCTQVKAGGFHPNLGLKVQGERARRAQEGEKRRQTARTREEDRQCPSGSRAWNEPSYVL
ncbi:MAG: hypothetical protein WBM52_08415, partial [Thiogranum sp.]